MTSAVVDGDPGTAVSTRRLVARPGVWVIWGVVAFFFINLFGLVGTVFVNSLSTQWFGTWWPKGLTTHYYADAWKEFALFDVLKVTLQVSLAVVVISILIGVPAAYALARRDFPGKRPAMLAFLL